MTMTFNQWLSWVFSVIVSSVQWLASCQLLGTSLLYILLGIAILGIVIGNIIFRAKL